MDAKEIDLGRMTAAMMYVGAERTRVEWVWCMTPNAFFSPSENRVYLCYELLPVMKTLVPDDWAGAIRAVAAHELAHAVITNQGAPFTGSEEGAADELAAISLIEAGMGADVLAVSVFWAGVWDLDPTITWGALDENHPAAIERARAGVCLVAGRALAHRACVDTYIRARESWYRILKR